MRVALDGSSSRHACGKHPRLPRRCKLVNERRFAGIGGVVGGRLCADFHGTGRGCHATGDVADDAALAHGGFSAYGCPAVCTECASGISYYVAAVVPKTRELVMTIQH